MSREAADLNDWLHSEGVTALAMNEHANACLGYIPLGEQVKLVYNLDLVIENLRKDMTHDEAWEWFYHNMDTDVVVFIKVKPS